MGYIEINHYIPYLLYRLELIQGLEPLNLSFTKTLLCQLSYISIWLGWLDLNQRMSESKSDALAAWLHPNTIYVL